MTSKLNRRHLALIALVVLAIAGFCWKALAESQQSTKPENQSNSAADMQLSGEELWTMNCQRCHNIRPPTMYSGAQWDVIVHHMRVRANITGEEQRAILEFLKSSSH
jgi:cytochrome c5